VLLVIRYWLSFIIVNFSRKESKKNSFKKLSVLASLRDTFNLFSCQRGALACKKRVADESNQALRPERR
jgi:hypothetical protein